MTKPRIFAKNVDEMSRAEWLELRRQGIGGSDAAAICGANPWRGPLSVYLSKIGAVPDTEPTETMNWGIELEDAIARNFSRRTQYKIRRSNVILQHPLYDFMLGNVDRLVRDTDEAGWGILEVKNVGEYRAEDWAEGNVPEYYQIQGAHYLAITGLDYIWFAPLIGGNKLRPIKLARDEKLIKSLIKIEEKFWKLVQSRTPPPIDDSPEATKVLKHLYPQSKGESVVIDEDLYTRLKAAKARVIEVEKEARGLENTIKEQMKECEAAFIPGNPKPILTWKGTTVKRLDVAALEAAEPEIAMRFYKESSTRRFLVK